MLRRTLLQVREIVGHGALEVRMKGFGQLPVLLRGERGPGRNQWLDEQPDIADLLRRRTCGQGPPDHWWRVFRPGHTR